MEFVIEYVCSVGKLNRGSNITPKYRLDCDQRIDIPGILKGWLRSVRKRSGSLALGFKPNPSATESRPPWWYTVRWRVMKYTAVSYSKTARRIWLCFDQEGGGISFIFRLYKKGPNLDPWGTLSSLKSMVGNMASARIWKVRSKRKEDIPES